MEEFVGGLLDPSKDTAAFQTLARDFLIQLKEFNSDQWTESSLSLQLEMQHKEAEKIQVPPPPNTHLARGRGRHSVRLTCTGRAACKITVKGADGPGPVEPLSRVFTGQESGTCPRAGQAAEEILDDFSGREGGGMPCSASPCDPSGTLSGMCECCVHSSLARRYYATTGRSAGPRRRAVF